jgi:predicted dehydrogenase/threonine dehydrogenase-like Zn-dependent dehydrogenase
MRDGKTMIVEVPVPTPRAGTALIKTAASLVSAGTERMLVEFAQQNLLGKARSRPDLVKQVLDKARRDGLFPTVQSAFNRLDQPISLGYSSAGMVAALGADMHGFKIGQRVACAGSGYAVHAEYALVPRNLLTPLPQEVDFETAAFVTLGAIALHGFRLAEPQIGESVAVVGLGLVGLLAGQIAAAAGCRVLGIDIDSQRAALAGSLGLKAVGRNKAEAASLAFTARRGFDVVLICADTPSNDPVELAAVIARDRARIVATGAVGLNIPRKIYYEKELAFINSRAYGPGRYDGSYEELGRDYPIGYVRWTEGRNLESVVELMAQGKLKVGPLITHRFPIERAAEAYAVITKKKKESFLGVLLHYPASKRQVSRNKTISKKPKQQNQTTDRVRLGVIGAGNFANAVLLPAIKKTGDFELIGIASSGGLHAQNSARKFGFRYATSAAEEIINDSEINAVAILTQHDSHADLVIQSLISGKHVFVEKPLAINDKQLSAIERQLRKSETLLTVGFNRRFSPLAPPLTALLNDRSESLHAHYRVNARYIPLEHWTQDETRSGGRIIGEACHFVDFISFLVGAAPCSVSAQALPDYGKYRDDNVSMTFSFPDGSLGVVDYLANGDSSFSKERVEIFCGGRVAVLDDFKALEMVQDGKRTLKKLASQDKGWTNEMKAFAQSIRAGGQPPIAYDQLVGVTTATFAVVESIRLRKTIDLQ